MMDILDIYNAKFAIVQIIKRWTTFTLDSEQKNELVPVTVIESCFEILEKNLSLHEAKEKLSNRDKDDFIIIQHY